MPPEPCRDSESSTTTHNISNGYILNTFHTQTEGHDKVHTCTHLRSRLRISDPTCMATFALVCPPTQDSVITQLPYNLDRHSHLPVELWPVRSPKHHTTDLYTVHVILTLARQTARFSTYVPFAYQYSTVFNSPLCIQFPQGGLGSHTPHHPNAPISLICKPPTPPK